ncbi:MAG: nucleoside kinase [Clostridiales bacterium]|nr:nucleoside kinase [Clostridiales bacterium]
MTDTIIVNISDEEFEYKKGITLEDIANSYRGEKSTPIVAAKVDNILRELSYRLDEDSNIEFIDLSMDDGVRIYLRSLIFVFIRACNEVFPGCSVSIEHTLGNGLYCEIDGDFPMTPRQIKKIEDRMGQIVDQNEAFERIKVSIEDAKDIFNEMGFYDKMKILKYRPENFVNLYKLGWMYDYLYGYMVPSAGYLKEFKLQFHLPGVVLLYPSKHSPDKVEHFKGSPKLFNVFRESEKWSRRIEINNAADLNRAIEEGRGGELIRICEAQQERAIAQIADDISDHRDGVRVILIAGPSSSGKTTFAQRLRVQLMVSGLNPISISMDNYFLNREDIPLNEAGERDMESIDVIDIELFNEHLTALIQGQEVDMPYFNFERGAREYIGNVIQINEDQPIIIEGIHGLNERLTSMIPMANKYKIYISALTQLNIDNHNRIPTTDTRLIRRMVRDKLFRGTPIEGTLSMWPLVRAGEEKYIFPYQEQADFMINSALIYELAVLKPYILPLLREISKDSPHYIEANRLRKFMKYFVELKPDDIPNNSIMREFIGGSCFEEV